MIHSSKPTVSPVAKIVFFLFCLVRFEKWGRTDGRTYGRTYERTTCAKTMIPTGRDCGSAEWINWHISEQHFDSSGKKNPAAKDV